MLCYTGYFTSRPPCTAFCQVLRNKNTALLESLDDTINRGAKRPVPSPASSLFWERGKKKIGRKILRSGHHFGPVQCSQTLAAILQLGNHFENVPGKLSELADTVSTQRWLNIVQIKQYRVISGKLTLHKSVRHDGLQVHLCRAEDVVLFIQATRSPRALTLSGHGAGEHGWDPANPTRPHGHHRPLEGWQRHVETVASTAQGTHSPLTGSWKPHGGEKETPRPGMVGIFREIAHNAT